MAWKKLMKPAASAIKTRHPRLKGKIYHRGNVHSYNDDPHDATGRVDVAPANPPFNDSDWFHKDDNMRWQFDVPLKSYAN